LVMDQSEQSLTLAKGGGEGGEKKERAGDFGARSTHYVSKDLSYESRKEKAAAPVRKKKI